MRKFIAQRRVYTVLAFILLVVFVYLLQGCICQANVSASPKKRLGDVEQPAETSLSTQ